MWSRAASRLDSRLPFVRVARRREQPHELRRAGLMARRPVIALTNDDEANLAITMSAALMRPTCRWSAARWKTCS